MHLLKKTFIQTRYLNRLPLFSFWLILFFSSLALIQACKKHDDNNPPIPSLDLKLVADGLVSPLGVQQAPGDDDHLFVLDQSGKIWVINEDGTKMPTPFLDVTSKMVALNPGYDERGLLGLAFHPNYKTNGRFFVYYNAPPHLGGPTVETGNTNLPKTWSSLTRIAEFKVSGNPYEADAASEKVLLEEDHPQFNHNGGTIAFGPDGYLYISIGDGGNADDIGPGHVDDWYKVNAGGNGQDVKANLLGNILRIDVDKTTGELPYGIPESNPFWGKPGRNEIYAYGFRNPYRFSFDMGGQHQLFAGDAGQSLYEEVDIVVKGGNYGWNVKEGTHCFSTDNDKEERSGCPLVDSAGNPLLDPVIEMKNTANPKGGGIASAVVGGNVYRGHDIAGLEGNYIFGAFSGAETGPSGKLYMSQHSGFGLWSFSAVNLKSFPGNLGQFVKGFGQDLKGEIYVTTSTTIGPSGNTGKIYKLIVAQ